MNIKRQQNTQDIDVRSKNINFLGRDVSETERARVTVLLLNAPCRRTVKVQH